MLFRSLVGFRMDYQRHLFEAMLECAPQYEICMSEKDVFYTPSSTEYFEQFVQSRDRYDAAICPNYQVALTLVAYCKEYGIRIPEDLYIISISNAIAMQYADPSLTTVSVSLELMAQCCVDTWSQIMRINQRDVSICVNLPTNIHQIGRASCRERV